MKYRNVTLEYRCDIQNCVFGGFNWIGEYTKVVNTTIGKYSYIANNTSIANTKIGKFCSIGPSVIIAPGIHPTSEFVSTYPSFYSNPYNLKDKFLFEKDKFQSYKNVNIGNDVWIGAHAIILDGIEIGDGAIIAANSVVTKNVNSFEIVGGVPAKMIKHRFSTDQINTLNKFEWWNKNTDWIKDNINLFHSIDAFIKGVNKY